MIRPPPGPRSWPKCSLSADRRQGKEEVGSLTRGGSAEGPGAAPRDESLELPIRIPWGLRFTLRQVALEVKKPPADAGDLRRAFNLWVGKIRWRRKWLPTPGFLGFPGGSDGKESTCNVGDRSSTPELGRSPGGGHVYPLQYPCLENPMDRGAWRAAVHGVTKSRTWLKRGLSTHEDFWFTGIFRFSGSVVGLGY